MFFVILWNSSLFIFSHFICFFYTQLVFILLFLRDSCIVYNHFLAFCFFFFFFFLFLFFFFFFSCFSCFFSRDFSESFLCFLIISGWQIFRNFYIYEKNCDQKIIKKLMLKNGSWPSYHIINNFFYKSLKIT